MVFPLLAVLGTAGAVGIGGGLLWFGKEAGEGAGKSIDKVLIIAAIGLIAFFILRKQGRV